MVLGLPLEVFYLLLLVLVVALVFLYFKRPIYEAMIIGFAFSIVMTGRYDIFTTYLLYPATSSNLFYIIVGFLALSNILARTHVVEKLIMIMLAIVGRLTGGAGYVALLSSSLLAMVTGTGPGNVAATGVFTIPAMIKSGFSRELAATTEMAASMLGNQMGPGLNLVGFSILVALYPEANYDLGIFWLALWIVGGWLFVQRLITLYILCKIEGVKPLSKADCPKLSVALREGWTALLLPLFILAPILINSTFAEQITARIGEAGASAFSNTVMMFTIGVCAVYAIVTGKNSLKKNNEYNFFGIYNMFRSSIGAVVPVGTTIYFAYSISLIFKEVALADAIQTWFPGFGFGRLGWSLLVVIFCAVLGMVLPGSSQVALLGSVIISTGAAVGIDPFLVAAVMPAITGVMEGMTPPLALGLFTAMGIAKSDFVPTAKMAYIWIIGNMLVSVLLFMGILPIFVV